MRTLMIFLLTSIIWTPALVREANANPQGAWQLSHGVVDGRAVDLKTGLELGAGEGVQQSSGVSLQLQDSWMIFQEETPRGLLLCRTRVELQSNHFHLVGPNWEKYKDHSNSWVSSEEDADDDGFMPLFPVGSIIQFETRENDTSLTLLPVMIPGGPQELPSVQMIFIR